MKKINYLFLTALSTLFFVSCNNSDFDGYKKTESGLHYQIIGDKSDSANAQVGDGISFKYTFKLKSNDSVLMNSSAMSPDGIMKFIVSAASHKGGIEEGFTLMAPKDSASFIISADSFYLKTNKMQALPPFIKPGDFLVVNVKMVEVVTKAQMEINQKKQEEELAKLATLEKPALDKYIADNKITEKPTASGLYVIHTKKGNGLSPKVTDLVTVHYTGMLLNGVKFDSSYDRKEPATFPLNGVIPGWQEAFTYLAKGGKAKLIIPSNLAYGSRGAGQQIPPFSTLVFEVELIDFKKSEQPAAPQTAPQAK